MNDVFLYFQGWYIVTYALGIYHLNLFIAFLTPKIDPALEELGEEDLGVFLSFVFHSKYPVQYMLTKVHLQISCDLLWFYNLKGQWEHCLVEMRTKKGQCENPAQKLF